MTKSKILIGLLALTLVIGINILIAIFVYPRLVFASRGRGWFNQMGLGGGISSRETRLAEALGLTVAELQTAQEAARTAAIQQAVDQGLITQAQADRMLRWGWLGFGGHPNGGEGGRKFERRGPGGRGGEWGMPSDGADFFNNSRPIAPFAAPGDTI